jgi:hypothetical protein
MCTLQTTPHEIVLWITAPAKRALNLRRLPVDGAVTIIPWGGKDSEGGLAV